MKKSKFLPVATAPRLLVLSLTLLLGACATEAPPESPAVATRTPAQMLAAVQQAGQGQDERELDVQPLRDNEVEDLREMAVAATRRGENDAAAASLDQALAIVPQDPAVLQERAEVALLQSDFDRAEADALRAIALGSEVGPWCRRHWETVHQVRARRHEVAAAPIKRPNEEKLAEQARALADIDRGIGEARDKLAACTVPGINRM
ncbi:hypothetical protein [Pseudoxanthomonas indica]|uniref:Uncharacterized protein n=1 Tax=Pseudoxanthomonas indica TaxID=428993 RepID=A0A1T5LHL6_9GAMM|nr:hypothetical protein [Pseudoxanthomonas indica]GGD35380.1 hypothetical protein GCM10007235_04190 [Pseudoxanthomonas indica]SKC75480.1 hypothetical protein SAMN06296058_2545 [Pseudoxanthomonas indica]